MQITQGLYGHSKVSLGLFPTPMYRLDNLSRRLGIELWIKRDDLCGVALGGNKVRKLEYLLADAIAEDAQLIMTTGQAQSNHAMLTAACALRLGLQPLLVLKDRGITACRGNQLLNRLMGAEVQLMDTDSYDRIYAEMDRIAEARGLRGYKIPCGGSNALGALGYMDGMHEIAAAGVPFRHIALACGSGGTTAGVRLGAAAFMPDAHVLAMCVDSDPFDVIVQQIVDEFVAMTGEALSLPPIDYIDVCGAGYSIPSEEGMQAIRLMLHEEGIVLDPCYTGKAFAGLLRCVQDGRFAKDEPVLFIHTGGAGGLFAPEFEL